MNDKESKTEREKLIDEAIALVLQASDEQILAALNAVSNIK